MSTAQTPTPNLRADLLPDLYKRLGAVHINRHNGFVVRGMRISPFYIEGMKISTSAEGLATTTKLFADAMKDLEFDAIAAPSISGIPYASVLSHQFGKKLIIDRGIPSKQGMRQRIEGQPLAGDRVIVVDDIAKRGQTLIEIAGELRALGCIIVSAFVVVDATKDQEKLLLQQSNIKLVGLTTLAELGVDPALTLDNSLQP